MNNVEEGTIPMRIRINCRRVQELLRQELNAIYRHLGGRSVTTPTPVHRENGTTLIPARRENEKIPTPAHRESVRTMIPARRESGKTPTPVHLESGTTQTQGPQENDVIQTPVHRESGTTLIPVHREGVT